MRAHLPFRTVPSRASPAQMCPLTVFLGTGFTTDSVLGAGSADVRPRSLVGLRPGRRRARELLTPGRGLRVKEVGFLRGPSGKIGPGGDRRFLQRRIPSGFQRKKRSKASRVVGQGDSAQEGKSLFVSRSWNAVFLKNTKPSSDQLLLALTASSSSTPPNAVEIEPSRGRSPWSALRSPGSRGVRMTFAQAPGGSALHRAPGAVAF